FNDKNEIQYISNNHEINKVILTALKDLDDTFFVEHSNSEKTNSVLNNDNNKEILDINLDRLNKFEFIEVSDNYIKDVI
ncbi:14685_t:CDS:1, partial [Dentiscutata heterogama]